ncbi:MAG: hypothetical protein CM15mP74_15260 [Halieaceae bacterium]|nr:MAG: hypothetical protein CM15mP74_15260 [Halieaceae bacterium]
MVLRRLLAKRVSRGRPEQWTQGRREPLCGAPDGSVTNRLYTGTLQHARYTRSVTVRLQGFHALRGADSLPQFIKQLPLVSSVAGPLRDLSR